MLICYVEDKSKSALWSLFIPARNVIPFSAENESRITETTILPGTREEVTELLPVINLLFSK